VVIVDSTVWIDYLCEVDNAETAWLDRALELERIGLTDLILCEVLQGARGDSAFLQLKRRLLEFAVFDAGGVERALSSAENYLVLRAKGITVRKTIDCLIATFCIEEGNALLHRDRDFEPFERYLGLRVVHP
jgi:predicted nucleic acid-binding protein